MPRKLRRPPRSAGFVACHYNYCRRHSTLKGHTPAMAHRLATEVWSVRKMLDTVTAYLWENLRGHILVVSCAIVVVFCVYCGPQRECQGRRVRSQIEPHQTA